MTLQCDETLGLLGNFLGTPLCADIDFDGKLAFILNFTFLFGVEQLASKVIPKKENLGFKSCLSVCNADSINGQLITVKSKICFDSGQLAGGAQNLQGQCAVVIYSPKGLSILLT